MKQYLLALLLLLPACSGCHHEAWPDKPIAPREFSPPANYRDWYGEAEKCVGMKGDYDKVHWFVNPTPWGHTTFAQFYVYRDSLGFPRQEEITISVGLWLDSMIVIHESIHDILWRNGWSAPSTKGVSLSQLEHPSPPFGKCAPANYPWPQRKDTT